MDDLLPHYERELAFLKKRSGDFARLYPKVAGRLQLGADVGEDPHVERMLESFALLSSRIHRRLEDDFPLFTESLLQVLYPHYLRPFPACSIAQFDIGASAGQMTSSITVPRGTQLSTRAVKGVACKFRTSQDVTLQPIQITALSYRSSVLAPAGTRLPSGATSVLSMTLKLVSPQASWRILRNAPLLAYIDGEPSQVSVLREALCHKAIGVMVSEGEHTPWQSAESCALPGASLRPELMGFSDEEALIDGDARAHPAYRLLTEYFGFPEKFNFVKIHVPVPASLAVAQAEEDGLRDANLSLTVHFLFSGIRSDSNESRLLETVHTKSLVLGCTPVVNLFKQPADPIRITHATTSYPVVVDGRRAFAYEVYSIDKVFRVRQSSQGESVQSFRPFFSLQHDDLLGGAELGGKQFDDEAPSVQSKRMLSSCHEKVGGRYWSVHRNDEVADLSPGYETEISVVDVYFDAATPHTDTLSLTVTATNRDLPSLLSFGVAGGDLFMEGGGPAKEIRMLRKATQSQQFERNKGALWRLISHLSLNHLSLSGGGIDALKEMLRLYDLPRSASNRKQVNGLVAIDFKPATAWLPGEPYATFVRGTEVRLTVDEDSLVGTGLGLFAAVLDHFFGLYVHANSFTKLTLISARTQEELHSCPPRNGDMPLV
jgi:type VI secretion system protein ImpG